jgi:hypothetical protein
MQFEPGVRARWRRDLRALLAMCALLGLCSRSAAAQYKRDSAAKREISKAITGYYLKMKFDEAEQRLLGVIEACADKCRPATIASAWMYVGVVRGSGKDEHAGARKAFDAALAADLEVVLDDAMATPETQSDFQAARNALQTRSRAIPLIGVPSGSTAAAPVEPEPKPAPTAIACSPEKRELQTRRPIPVECRGDAEAARASLRYQVKGDAGWKSLEMKRSGAGFRTLIPCEDTMNAGVIQFFVVVSDRAGDPLETLGSKSAPERFVVDASSDTAPAFEGEEPPARCEERVICPPDFPGCEDSTAEKSADDDVAPKPYRANWLGLHFAPDIGFIQGSDVCATSNPDFECFSGGSPYPAELPASVAGQPGERGDPYPGTGIRSGASGGTLRALLSYDHAFSERFSLGARLGYAFGGAPASANGRRFLPIHAEGRVQFWLRALSADGLLPYVHLGGGVAQVDIKKSGVTVQDCSAEPARQSFLDCIDATNAYDSGNDPVLPKRTLVSYRRLGNAFGTAGGGVLLPLGGSAALQLNLNAMLMLPASGFVLQPSIGLGYAL